MTADLQ